MFKRNLSTFCPNVPASALFAATDNLRTPFDLITSHSVVQLGRDVQRCKFLSLSQPTKPRTLTYKLVHFHSDCLSILTYVCAKLVIWSLRQINGVSYIAAVLLSARTKYRTNLTSTKLIGIHANNTMSNNSQSQQLTIRSPTVVQGRHITRKISWVTNTKAA